MVKKFLYTLFATLVVAGCSDIGDNLQPAGEEQQVAVSIDVSRFDGDADLSSSLLGSESSILRIMDANDNL
ncbi:MAG: lipoprotein, partial [Rikenellaceae bacterium]